MILLALIIRKARSLIHPNGPFRQAKHKPVKFASIPDVFGVIMSDLGSVFFSFSAHVKHDFRAGFKWLQFSLWTQEGVRCQREPLADSSLCTSDVTLSQWCVELG